MQVQIDTKIMRVDKDNAIQMGGQCNTCGHVENGEDLTFRKAVIRSLLNTDIKEADKRLERFTLAQMIQAAPPTLSLDNDQIQIIKDDIAIAYGTIVLGRIYEMLDPEKMDKLRKLATPTIKPGSPNA